MNEAQVVHDLNTKLLQSADPATGGKSNLQSIRIAALWWAVRLPVPIWKGSANDRRSESQTESRL